jgi:hypothetical protein
MRHRLVALGAWVVLIVAAQVAIQRSGKGTVEALSDAVEVARGAWWALPAYLAAYAARSLVLFPAVLLTVAAGVLFGAWLGMPIALLGAVISAAISYEIARTIGPHRGHPQPSHREPLDPPDPTRRVRHRPVDAPGDVALRSGQPAGRRAAHPPPCVSGGERRWASSPG